MLDLGFLEELDRFSPAQRSLGATTACSAPIAASVATLPLAAPDAVQQLEHEKQQQQRQQQQHMVPHPLSSNGFESERYQNALESGIKYAHGTTTLGFVFNGGVLIAVDSRASMGSYIGNSVLISVYVPVLITHIRALL